MRVHLVISVIGTALITAATVGAPAPTDPDGDYLTILGNTLVSSADRSTMASTWRPDTMPATSSTAVQHTMMQ
jgi:hypothetical protein